MNAVGKSDRDSCFTNLRTSLKEQPSYFKHASDTETADSGTEAQYNYSFIGKKTDAVHKPLSIRPNKWEMTNHHQSGDQHHKNILQLEYA